MRSGRRIDKAAAKFALATAVAALTALAVAWSLGLSHGYWASLTVVFVVQPTRALLWRRSTGRLIGTAFGAAAAFLLLLWSGPHEMALVAGLIVWTGLCTGGALLSRGAGAYAALLAGYTACILVLAVLRSPDAAHVLASDRLYCTALGIVASLPVAAILPRAGAGIEHIQDRLAEFIGLCCRLAAEGLRTGRLAAEDTSRLAQAIGEIDRLAEKTGAASAALLPRGLALVAASLADARGGTLQAAHAQRVGRRGRRVPRPAFRVDEATLQMAAEAAARSMTALSLVIAAWLATGWSGGRNLATATAVLIVLFSSHQDPAAATGRVLWGSLAGAAAAIAVLLVALWVVVTPGGAALLIFPVLLAGAYAMARPATEKSGIDFCVTFLLVMQPGVDVPPGLAAAASGTLAIIGGVAVATLSFRFLFPARASRQRATLLKSSHAQLAVLARSDDPAAAVRAEEQIVQRAIRILQLSTDRSDIDAVSAMTQMVEASLLVARVSQNATG